jgi:hypothetical protein
MASVNKSADTWTPIFRSYVPRNNKYIFNEHKKWKHNDSAKSQAPPVTLEQSINGQCL